MFSDVQDYLCVKCNKIIYRGTEHHCLGPYRTVEHNDEPPPSPGRAAWANCADSIGGYVCGSCGTWIPTGSAHICTVAAGSQLLGYPVVDAQQAVLERIAKALEDIVAALNKMH